MSHRKTAPPNAAILIEAQDYAKTGSYSLALESINKSLEADGKKTEAWLFKGQVLFQLGRPSEALNSLNKALELDQYNASAWGLKGRILSTTGKYKMAQLCFRLCPAAGAREYNFVEQLWHRCKSCCKIMRVP